MSATTERWRRRESSSARETDSGRERHYHREVSDLLAVALLSRLLSCGVKSHTTSSPPSLTACLLSGCSSQSFPSTTTSLLARGTWGESGHRCTNIIILIVYASKCLYLPSSTGDEHLNDNNNQYLSPLRSRWSISPRRQRHALCSLSQTVQVSS